MMAEQRIFPNRMTYFRKRHFFWKKEEGGNLDGIN